MFANEWTDMLLQASRHIGNRELNLKLHDMKKVVLLAMMAVCLSSFTAMGQTKTRGQKPLTAEQVTEKFKELSEIFCTYIERIGSTGSLTEKEKDRMRREEVPKLFFRYGERYMKTTQGVGGVVIRKPKMKDYFYNLQKQARRGQATIGNIVAYDMSFILSSKEDGTGNLKWKHHKTYDDGTKEYHSEITFYQTYVKMSMRNNEVYSQVIHDDEKTMVVFKMVYPNGDEEYKLGDITGAKRLDTDEF